MSDNIYNKEALEQKYSEIADKLRNRQEELKGTERIYTVDRNGQRGDEVTIDHETVAKRKEALAEQLVKNRAALEEQAELMQKHSKQAEDHLLELASGATVTNEDGLPSYVSFDKPETPELDQLHADYDRARKDGNAAGMARAKNRIATVKEEERRHRAYKDSLNGLDPAELALDRAEVEQDIELSQVDEYEGYEEDGFF